jgi:hypothetical protein
MRYTKIIFIQLSVYVALTAVSGQLPPAADNIEFKIIMPQQIYSAGATARAWLVVINSGRSPIYLRRPLVQCSNYSVGYADVRLLDKRGRDVNKEKRCAADGFLSDPVADLADARFWIELAPGEIYGSEADIELPTDQLAKQTGKEADLQSKNSEQLAQTLEQCYTRKK